MQEVGCRLHGTNFIGHGRGVLCIKDNSQWKCMEKNRQHRLIQGFLHTSLPHPPFGIWGRVCPVSLPNPAPPPHPPHPFSTVCYCSRSNFHACFLLALWCAMLSACLVWCVVQRSTVSRKWMKMMTRRWWPSLKSSPFQQTPGSTTSHPSRYAAVLPSLSQPVVILCALCIHVLSLRVVH